MYFSSYQFLIVALVLSAALKLSRKKKPDAFFDVVVLFHLLAIADKMYGNHCALWSVKILIKMHFLENGVLSVERLLDIHKR